MNHYYIKVIKMGTIESKYNRDEDGVSNLHKMEDVSFTADGLGRDPDPYNCFTTPREALLAFSKMVERHPNWNYVDIVMAEFNYCIM